MEENKVSLIGVDGKVRWLPESKVREFVDKGWRTIVNPKETYYPEYDQALTRPQRDEVGNSTRIIENHYKDILGIIVL